MACIGASRHLYADGGGCSVASRMSIILDEDWLLPSPTAYALPATSTLGSPRGYSFCGHPSPVRPEGDSWTSGRHYSPVSSTTARARVP